MSPAGRDGRGSDVSLTIKQEDIAKERQRGRVRDKYAIEEHLARE